MRIENELRKVQILTNIISRQIEKNPLAYGDTGSNNPTLLHNWRAEIIYRIERGSYYLVKIEDNIAKLYIKEDYFRKRGWI